MVISDDEEKSPRVSPPVAAAVVPEAEYEWPPTAGWSEDEDEDVPRPDWLPDGFGMEGYKQDDGTFQATVRPSDIYIGAPSSHPWYMHVALRFTAAAAGGANCVYVRGAWVRV